MPKQVPLDLMPGTLHSTKNYGTAKVVSYTLFDQILIEFMETGFRKLVSGKELRKGSVRDPFYKSVLGVGFIGQGPFNVSLNGLHTDSYKRWSSMLYRCYSEKYQNLYPSYIGCTVCEEWHCFQNFAEWYESNRPNSSQDFHLDKDSLIAGNKIYSPQTVTFISPSKNMSLAGKRSAKPYSFRSPDGIVFSGVSTKEFSEQNGLDQGAMQRVLSGKASHHKGWTKVPDHECRDDYQKSQRMSGRIVG